MLLRRLFVLLGPVLLILALSLPRSGSVSAQVREPTPIPAITEDIRPTLTPTSAVVLLVTPTPNRLPPSLIITELDPARSAGAVPVEIDEAIERFWWWLYDRQMEYFRLSGEFAQMFWTHKELPADATKGIYPEEWYSHPTDQDWSWDDINAIQYEPLPFAIKIDVYSGPRGVGYVACFRLAIGGAPYERCRNYGAESRRAHVWQIVEEVRE